MRVALTAADRARLLAPATGEGGWQDLIRKLQGQITDDAITLDESDIERIQLYNVGQGGWQYRIAPLVEAIRQRGV